MYGPEHPSIPHWNRHRASHPSKPSNVLIANMSHNIYQVSSCMQVCVLECTPYAGRHEVNTAVLFFVCRLLSISPLDLSISSVSILATTALPCHLDNPTLTRRRNARVTTWTQNARVLDVRPHRAPRTQALKHAAAAGASPLTKY